MTSYCIVHTVVQKTSSRNCWHTISMKASCSWRQCTVLTGETVWREQHNLWQSNWPLDKGAAWLCDARQVDSLLCGPVSAYNVTSSIATVTWLISRQLVFGGNWLWRCEQSANFKCSRFLYQWVLVRTRNNLWKYVEIWPSINEKLAVKMFISRGHQCIFVKISW